MHITRIYTGDDGKSHFEDVEIPLSEGGAIGRISELQGATGVLFREVDGDYDFDFHCAPRRQYVINLDAAVEIETGDGSKRRIGSSMRCSRCRDHVMLPATGGRLRGDGGLCLSRSYCTMTSSSSLP